MFKLKQDRKEMRFGEEVELDVDIKAEDIYGNESIIKKGTIGYMSNYHFAVFANGNMIYNREELKCNGEVDKSGIASYIYHFLCEEISLDEMLDCYKISQARFEKAVMAVLNKRLAYSKEYSEDSEYFVLKVDSQKLATQIYKCMKRNFPITRMLKSLDVTKDMLRAGIKEALDMLFFYVDDVGFAEELEECEFSDTMLDSYEIIRINQ